MKIDKELQQHILEQFKKREDRDIVVLAQMLGFKVCELKHNESGFCPIRSYRDGNVINVIQPNYGYSRFLVAYHLAEYLLGNEEFSAIYMDDLYDKEIYEYAADLLLSDEIEYNLNDLKTECDKYHVSARMLIAKMERKNAKTNTKKK